jgi:hypothetical protein
VSSQAVWAQATSGLGALLVSLFNVKWRFSEQAGGVEGSKFCQNLSFKSVTISLVALSFWKEHGAFMIIPHILKENKF